MHHAVVLYTVTSVLTERYLTVEGKTPEIGSKKARDLQIGLRDRAIFYVLIYTAVRVGAVDKLTIKSLKYGGIRNFIRFSVKGGKAREIPVRYDLELILQGYIEASGTPRARCFTRRSA